MPKFLIERKLPNAARLTDQELQGIAAKSNGVLADMQKDGKNIHWIESYVTADAIHCVYVADSQDLIREHAQCGGFPVTDIMPFRATIDASTAE